MRKVAFWNKVIDWERQRNVNRNGEENREEKGKKVRGLRQRIKKDKNKDCNKGGKVFYIGRGFRQQKNVNVKVDTDNKGTNRTQEERDGEVTVFEVAGERKNRCRDVSEHTVT